VPPEELFRTAGCGIVTGVMPLGVKREDKPGPGPSRDLHDAVEVAAIDWNRKRIPVQSNGVVYSATFGQEKVASHFLSELFYLPISPTQKKCWVDVGNLRANGIIRGRFEFFRSLG
jgi:hypothetical protein